MFEVRVDAASTDDLIAGPYQLIARVTDGSTVKSWLARRVLVHADPASVVGAKSFNRTMRDTLRTAAIAAAGDAAVTIQVNGRTVTYARAEFDATLARYELLAAIEENPTGEIRHEVAFVRG